MGGSRTLVKELWNAGSLNLFELSVKRVSARFTNTSCNHFNSSPDFYGRWPIADPIGRFVLLKKRTSFVVRLVVGVTQESLKRKCEVSVVPVSPLSVLKRLEAAIGNRKVVFEVEREIRLAYIIQSRHPELLKERTPVRRRRYRKDQ